MKTLILTIIAAVVEAISRLLRRSDTRQDRQDGANELELEARRKLDQLELDADDARNSVRNDGIASDPNNRRRI